MECTLELSPSAQRIRAIAVEHFAEHGYEGASLNLIATTAGMKKASLYFHFANKDQLFLTALEHALATETEHATHTFAAEAATLPGLDYLTAIGARYDEHASLRFLLRAAYAPPAALRETVAQGHGQFLDHIGETLRARLPQPNAAHTNTLVEAYLGAVDSLHVEVLFGNDEHLDRRRTALWSVLTGFWEAGS